MADPYDTIRDLARALNTVKTNGQAFQAGTAALAAARATETEAGRLSPPLYGPEIPQQVIGAVRRAAQILKPEVDRLKKSEGAFALPVSSAEWIVMRKHIEAIYIEGAPLIGYEGSKFNQAALLRDLGAAIASAPKQVLEFVGTTAKTAVAQAGGILKGAAGEVAGTANVLTWGALTAALPLLLIIGGLLYIVSKSDVAGKVVARAIP